MSTFVIGLSGGFGGIAPNLFRLGTALQSGEPMPDITYAIGVLIFFVIGAGLALDRLAGAYVRRAGRAAVEELVKWM